MKHNSLCLYAFCMFLLIAASLNAQIPTNGLVAHYPFNGNANDESGNVNHGTVNGPTLTTDRFGNTNKAYIFDGVDDYILVPDADMLDLTQNLSFSCWIKADTGGVILAKHIPGVDDDGSFYFVIHSDRRLLYSATPHWDPTSPRSDSLLWNQWEHAVFTYDINTQSWKYYLNGVLTNSGTNNYAILNTTHNLIIGKESATSFNFPPFKGKIDDIRIYNRALTPAEISVLYNEGLCEQNITVTDTINKIIIDGRDCQTYPIVKIGSQWWMAENINAHKYNDGTLIPNDTSAASLLNRTTGALCYYNNDSIQYAETYGALFNWYAVNDSRKICPNGWKIPTESDWNILEKGIDILTDTTAMEWVGTDIGNKLKDISFPNGTNESGFAALASGAFGEDGQFHDVTRIAVWWTNNAYDSDNAWHRHLHDLYSGIYRYYAPKVSGFSVRCIKSPCEDVAFIFDTTICFGESLTVGIHNYFTSGTFYDTLLTVGGCDSIITTNLTVAGQGETITDTINKFILDGRDCQYYPIVKIGNQWWMAENISTKKYRNGDAIPDGTAAGDISGVNEPKYWFYYDNNASNEATYGLLYTWNVLNDSRHLCPLGWSEPFGNELLDLTQSLGDSAGGKMKETGIVHWSAPNTGATNSTGFNMLPGGERQTDGTFVNRNNKGYLWRGSANSTSAWFYSYSYDSKDIIGGFTSKKKAYSARCVKNDPLVITLNPQPKTTCEGESVIITVNATGTDLTYQWQFFDGNFWANTEEGIYSGTTNDTLEILNALIAYNGFQYRCYVTDGVDSDTSNVANLTVLVLGITVTDTINKFIHDGRDCQNYPIVKIGTQWWMKENLAATKYQNGTTIPNDTSSTSWTGLTNGALCYYNNDSVQYAETYGPLYNWFAVNDSIKICPNGWHVPSDDEWKVLEMGLGMDQSSADGFDWRGTDEGSQLKESGTIHWATGNSGTNSTEFTALPGGFRNVFGTYAALNTSSFFATQTLYDPFSFLTRSLQSGYSQISRSWGNLENGISVRCIKNNPPEIAQHPQTKPTCESSNTSFTVSATGSGLSYQWQKKTTGLWSNVTNTGVYSGATNDTLSITAATVSMNNTQFRCFVTDGADTDTSEAAFLFVLATGVTITDTINKFIHDGRDCQNYPIVKISNQWWMKENLNSHKYADGSAIYGVTLDIEWSSLVSGACSYYSNDSAQYAETYGALYNWYAVDDSRGICSNGWHVPTHDEWTILERALCDGANCETDFPFDNTTNAWCGNNEGGKMKEAGTTHWTDPNNGATNSSGFSGLPAGYRNDTGQFWNIGMGGLWWTKNESSETMAWVRYLSYYYSTVSRTTFGKSYGYSVRCVKNDPPEIVENPHPKIVCEGSSTIFIVSATGSGLTYQWQSHDGNSWANTNEGIYSGTTNDTLEILNASIGFNGFQYRCVVTDGIDSDTSDAASLFVFAAGVTYTDTINKFIHDGRDCQNYPIVKIGTQWWMKENLAATKYQNGSAIPNVTNNTEWSNLTTGALSYYNNDSLQYAETYGSLYNWYAVNDSRKICPTGWHTSSSIEWNILELFLDNTVDTNIIGWLGTDIGGKLKEIDTLHWNNPNTGATNSSGFTALPGSGRGNDGSYTDIENGGCWWLKTEYDIEYAWIRHLSYNKSQIGIGTNFKNFGFSVRCIKNIFEDVAVTVDTAICQGESYIVGTHTYLNSGIYHDTIPFADGCDSIITTNLTVIPLPIITVTPQTETICSGDTTNIMITSDQPGTVFNWTYSASGVSIVGNLNNDIPIRNVLVGSGMITYTISASYNGCFGAPLDAVVYVNPNISSSSSILICQGQSYAVGTHSYTTAGTYIDTIPMVSGCDSIITTHLVVAASGQTITDTINKFILDGRDCRNYPIVKIGTQWWMKENLAATKYQNGSAIPNVANNTNWSNLTTGALSYYNNDSTQYAETYGPLYNWYAVNDSRGVCPTGWQVASDAEWTQLTSALGGESVASGKMKEIGLTHWSSPNTAATNESGFTALPGGNRIPGGSSYNINTNAFFWTSSEYNATDTWYRVLYHNSGIIGKASLSKNYGYSIRCIKSICSAVAVTIDTTVCGGPFIVGTSSYTSSGTYHDTIQMASGCDSIITTNLTVLSLPTTANAGADQQINLGELATLAANAPVIGTGIWTLISGTGGAILDANNPSSSFSGIASETYTLVWTISNLCGTSADTVIISFGCQPPVVTLGNDTTICGGPLTLNVSVSSGTGPYSYSWNSACTDDSCIVSESGFYSITVTDAENCSAADTIHVTIHALPTPVITGASSFCEGSSATLSTGNFSSYQWVSGCTDVACNVSMPGTYYVTVMDNNGCSGTSSPFIVSQAQNPVVNLGNDTTICANASITLNAFAGAGCTYIWSNGQTMPSITVSNSGYYSVTATNSAGCTDRDTIQVTKYLPIQIMINAANTLCGQAMGSATALVTGGTQPYDYLWSNGDTTDVATGLESGIFMLYITDANGCQNTATALISSSNGPNITSQTATNVSCYGGTNGTITINVSGGTLPYHFEWSNGDSIQNISNLAAGPYEVIITDHAGCQAVQSINITQPPQLNVTITSNNASCGNQDGSATASVSGGTVPYLYVWSNTNTSATAANLGYGTYTLTVQDANSCIITATTAITETDAPIILIDSVKNATCSGFDGAIYISVPAIGTYSYQWTGGSTDEDLVNTEAGIYSVTVTGGGCTAIAQAEIEVTAPAIQSLCIVSVDNTLSSPKNMLVWEKAQTTGISHYKIYKESSAAGVYLHAASVPYNAMSKWIDVNSNPKTRAYRYKISQVDSCGNESPQSDFHKTIHLTINLGQGDDMNLIWNHYYGYEYLTYFIYRYHSSTGWVALDSIPGDLNTYTDDEAPVTGNLKYQVSALRENECWAEGDAKDMSGPFSQSLSNIEDNGIIDVGISSQIYESDEIKIYPNPVKEELTIEINSDEIKNLKILNIIGKTISVHTIEGKTTLNTMNLPAGVYLVKIYTEKTSLIRRFVKQ